MRRRRRLPVLVRRRRRLPVLVVPANCMSVSTGPLHAANIFRAYLDVGADVILCTECADFDAHDVAHRHLPGVYDVRQLGRIGSPESALVVAVRRHAGRIKAVKLLPGVPATAEGGGIRWRPMLRVSVKLTGRVLRRRFTAGHADPERARRARDLFLTRFGVVGLGVRGGDLNSSKAELERRYPHRQVLVVDPPNALLVPDGIPVGRLVEITKAELSDPDHSSFAVALWPAA